MKVAISYPPLEGPGSPLLSQNRQFQWYRSPFTSYAIYPIVPAYAATLLAEKGYNVLWEDCAADKKSYDEFIKILEKEKPDILAIESKTPTIKKHWRIIDDIKEKMPNIRCVLMGDHPTALPEESLRKSSVDYVLAGGDYDFLLANLVDFLTGKRKDPGTGVYLWDKYKTKIVCTGGSKRGHNLNKLPIIDRKLTKWEQYSTLNNANFKYEPNTYTMIGRDCWWRRPSSDGKSGCTFCSWTSIFPTWRRASPRRLLDEIDQLIDLGIKEVFDDTGTFPVGAWLYKFCKGMIRRGYNKKIMLGCNMRAGALKQEEFELMKKANFRFILYGLESANQKTLDMLNKGTTPRQLEDSVQMASQAGLEPHVTIMFGYPWETKKQAQKTVDFARYLFEKGYIKTLQATILIPYPGTALYEQAKRKNWLLTEDYNEYDMSKPVLKTPMTEEELKKIVRSCYHTFWSPKFVFRQLKTIRSPADIKRYAYFIPKYISKLLDFLSVKS